MKTIKNRKKKIIRVKTPMNVSENELNNYERVSAYISLFFVIISSLSFL